MLKFELHRSQAWIEGLTHEATDLREMVEKNEIVRGEYN